jgi:acetyltransferase-like isoleucine patch superfamily enzyme
VSEVHPTAILAPDTSIEASTGIGAYCVIGVDGTGDPVLLGEAATVRSHCVIYRGVRAGNRLALGHSVLIREATVLADDVSIGSSSVIEHHVTMGDGVRLHSSCFVPEYSVLRDGSWLGPGVRLTNARYPNESDTKDQLEPVVIEEGAVVGAAAVILPGVRVGRDALVGAGAVVVRDVRDGATVVGNPATEVPTR